VVLIARTLDQDQEPSERRDDAGRGRDILMGSGMNVSDDVTEVEIEMLRKHLPYELDMMHEAFRILQGADDANGGTVRNAMIEAFWIHARNIMEFLTRRKRRRREPSGIASAKDFTGPEFSAELEPKIDKIRPAINVQITHLQYERKDAPQEKIADNKMDWIMQAIDSDMKRFEKHLQEKYRP